MAGSRIVIDGDRLPPGWPCHMLKAISTGNTAISTLQLHTHLREEERRLLLYICRTSMSLQTLDVSCTAEKRLLDSLCHAFVDNVTLTTMSFRREEDHSFSSNRGHGLILMLRRNTTLRVLDLNRNTEGFSTPVIEDIFSAIAGNTTLASFRFGCVALDNTSIRAVTHALRHNTTITELNLDGQICCNNENANMFISVAVHTNTTLKTLCLGGPQDWGTQEFSFALRSNTTLTSLALRNTTVYGMICIASALRDNTTLQHLKLLPPNDDDASDSDERDSDDERKHLTLNKPTTLKAHFAIVSALFSNKTLTSLDMVDENYYSYAGLMDHAWCHVIKKNTTLTALSIWPSQVPPEICNALATNKTLINIFPSSFDMPPPRHVSTIGGLLFPNNHTLEFCGKIINGERRLHVLSQYVRPHVRLIVRTRVLLQSGRATVRDRVVDRPLQWVCDHAPHWVVVCVCKMLSCQ